MSQPHAKHWCEVTRSAPKKLRERALQQLAEGASQLDLQAFSVARVMLIVAARKLNQSIEGDTLRLADQERLFRICDTARRLGRRVLGWEAD